MSRIVVTVAREGAPDKKKRLAFDPADGWASFLSRAADKLQLLRVDAVRDTEGAEVEEVEEVVAGDVLLVSGPLRRAEGAPAPSPLPTTATTTAAVAAAGGASSAGSAADAGGAGAAAAATRDDGDGDGDGDAQASYAAAQGAVMKQCLDQLKKLGSPTEVLAAVDGLGAILNNLAKHPGEPKYRRLVSSRPAFHARIGRFAPAVGFLRVCGWSAPDGTEDAAMALPAEAEARLPLREARAALEAARVWAVMRTPTTRRSADAHAARELQRALPREVPGKAALEETLAEVERLGAEAAAAFRAADREVLVFPRRGLRRQLSASRGAAQSRGGDGGGSGGGSGDRVGGDGGDGEVGSPGPAAAGDGDAAAAGDGDAADGGDGGVAGEGGGDGGAAGDGGGGGGDGGASERKGDEVDGDGTEQETAAEESVRLLAFYTAKKRRADMNKHEAQVDTLRRRMATGTARLLLVFPDETTLQASFSVFDSVASVAAFVKWAAADARGLAGVRLSVLGGSGKPLPPARLLVETALVPAGVLRVHAAAGLPEGRVPPALQGRYLRLPLREKLDAFVASLGQ